MKKFSTPLVLLVSIMLFTFIGHAQSTSVFPAEKTKFYISAGTAFSTIDLDREIHNISRGGLDVRVGLYIKNDLRIVGEAAYSRYNINPTWINVHSSNYELNLNYIGEIEESKINLYALGGINLQRWKAEFTGIDDVYRMRNYVNPGQYYSYSWGTLNTGFGIEKNFGRLGVFGELKLRINKVGLYPRISVIDIVYNFGLKYEFSIQPHHREKRDESGNKSNKKSIFKRLPGMPSDKYHWF